MKTMAQIDAWYEAEITQAKLEGQLEGELLGKIKSASTMIRAKFEADILTSKVTNQFEKLNDRQLDEFMVGMFNWQQPADMESWIREIAN